MTGCAYSDDLYAAVDDPRGPSTWASQRRGWAQQRVREPGLDGWRRERR